MKNSKSNNRSSISRIIIPLLIFMFLQSFSCNLSALYDESLDYTFRDASLRRHALQPRTANFERLEFLGDRVLGLVTAHLLYANYPEQEVGWLAQNFAEIVSKPSLYKIYKRLPIDESTLSSSSYQGPELGHVAEKTATDIVEALLGAQYLDGAFEAAFISCKRFLGKLYELDQKEFALPKSFFPDFYIDEKAQRRLILQKTFDYPFKNISLLHEAFRHSSVGGRLYKILDFIGVRVLSLYVASRIFQEYKTGDEELFVQVFENKINNDNIESVFQTWEFWRFLDNQYARTSVSDTPTRMAVDTVRAFIGSVYIDGGYDAVQNIIAQLLYARPSADYGTPPVLRLGVAHPTKKSSLNDSPPDDLEEWPALGSMKEGEEILQPPIQKPSQGKSYLQAIQKKETKSHKQRKVNTQKTSSSQPKEEWPALNKSSAPLMESPKWPILVQPPQKKGLKKDKKIIFHGVWKN